MLLSFNHMRHKIRVENFKSTVLIRRLKISVIMNVFIINKLSKLSNLIQYFILISNDLDFISQVVLFLLKHFNSILKLFLLKLIKFLQLKNSLLMHDMNFLELKVMIFFELNNLLFKLALFISELLFSTLIEFLFLFELLS